MLSAKKLCQAVGQWSQANFGQNLTALHPVVLPTATDEAQVGLGSLCPLMGLGEEIGELFADMDSEADMLDAVGDVCIYALDYAYREGVAVESRFFTPTPACHRGKGVDPLAGMVVAYGKLLRCHLKRYQRIRGMDNVAAFNEARDGAYRALLHHLADYAAQYWPQSNVLMIANQTWANVVAKRDWKAAPQDGGGHTHDNGPSRPDDSDDGGFLGNGANLPANAAHAALDYDTQDGDDWDEPQPVEFLSTTQAVEYALDLVGEAQAVLQRVRDAVAEPEASTDEDEEATPVRPAAKPVAPASSDPEPEEIEAECDE